MFESFVPDAGKSLNPSLNNFFTGFAGNTEPMDCITPQCDVKKLTTGGSSSELRDTTLRSPRSLVPDSKSRSLGIGCFHYWQSNLLKN